jgi:hypothetical protein
LSAKEDYTKDGVRKMVGLSVPALRIAKASLSGWIDNCALVWYAVTHDLINTQQRAKLWNG